MANTIASTLLPDILAEAVVTQAPNKLAALRGFSRDFSTDQMSPLAVVRVRKSTAGASGQTNPTNFESGDTTQSAISVTPQYLSVSFHITNAERNSGHRLQHLAEINADSFANLILDKVTATMTVGNFGAATVIGTAANFDSADLPAIYTLAKNYRAKNLILDGGHLAGLLPTTRDHFRIGEQGAFGFDLMAENNRWSGSATANLAGFVCGPDAIAVASGLPAMTEELSRDMLDTRTFTVPQIGLSGITCIWVSRASRELWASYDVIFGAAAGDTTQAELLTTA